MPKIEECLDLYEHFLVVAGRRPRGIEQYMRIFRRFVNESDILHVDHITVSCIRAYQTILVRRHCSPATVSNVLTVIRSFCRWALTHEYLETDPTLLITWPKVVKPAPRALRRYDIQQLMKAIEVPEHLEGRNLWMWQRNRRAIMLMLYGGLRISEVSKLRWRDIDLPGKSLMVLDGKGGKDRVVPIHPFLVDELTTCPERHHGKRFVCGKANGDSIETKSLAHVFERWLPKRGIEISAHRLRHSFATELLNHGVDLRQIQELLGHENLDTTQRYLAVSPGRLRSAVEALPTMW